jgi:8-oxo-dGTP pyrophosphatase MutT (NUDIX family)
MSTLFAHIEQLYRGGEPLDGVQTIEPGRVFPPDMVWRPAAVLAAITERERPGLLMIHRPSNMRAHPGQIALPGGKLDPGEDAVEAALREAWEELGIRGGDVRVVGSSDRYMTGSGYDITPVIGVVPPDLEIDPSPTEVAQWFEAPIDFVLDTANHGRRTVPTIDGGVRHVWTIQWQEHEIWGVTAAILVNLARRLRWND